MLIERVHISRIRVPIKYAYIGSRHVLRDYEKVIVRLYADNGLVGIGEAPGRTPVMEELKRISAIAVGHRIPACSLADGIYPGVLFRERPVTERIAAGGFEMAMWDLIGQEQGKSVGQLLGQNCRTEVDMVCELSAGPFPCTVEDHELKAFFSDIDNTARVVEHAMEQIEEYGYRALKLKSIGRSIEWDSRVMTKLREALPSDFNLRLDPNGAYSAEDAVELCNRLEGLALQWFEDPTATISGMTALRQKVNARLATNMCVISFEDIDLRGGLEAVDVVGVDAFHWAGLGNARAAVDVCRRGERDVFMHCYFDLGITTSAMLQLASTVPDLTSGMDTIIYLQGVDVTQAGEYRVTDGKLPVPSVPGVGIVLDERIVTELLIEEADYSSENVPVSDQRSVLDVLSECLD